MDAGYGEHYGELYRKHWWWRSREAFVMGILRTHQPASANRRILDIGCGDGLLFDKLATLGEVEGVEPDAKLITSTGRWRSHIHVRPFDSTFMPPHRFGRVVMLDVLEHIEQPVEALRHVVSLMEPGGSLYLTVPAFTSLWTSHDVLNRHYRRYTVHELRRELQLAGLEVEWSRYLFHWLVVPKLVLHLLERLRNATPRSPSVPARPLNAVLYALSRLEQWASVRVRIPVGSSLFVIATRRA